MSSKPTLAEDLALPAPSDPSTPLDLTPSHTPQPNGRDPIIQRSAVFGSRYLTDPTKVYDYNSWDQVEPDPEYLAVALEKIKFQEENRLSEKDRIRFLEKPAYFWDMFYRNNRENFFKNRQWLLREFPALKECTLEDAGEKVILEAGCGVGNAMFPILEGNQNPYLTIHGRDYSPRAIEVLREDPQFNSQYATADVWDITSESLPEGIAEESVDVITILFVLSALEPIQWKQAISNLYRLLKPGGLICFRDYGRYDMTQIRFKKERLLDDNFYIRGDGTRVYFFEESELEEMFSDFAIDQLVVDRRLLVNRQNLKKMYRVWFQGRFRKLKDGEKKLDIRNERGLRDVQEALE